MTQLETGTLILGASFYGCGLACALDNAIVVESSVAVGSDFTFGFEQGCNWNTPAAHPAAEEFRQELFKRHAVTEKGDLLTGALAPVFADWCIRHNVRPYLGLDLVQIKGNTATFIDFCGKLVSVKADRIIDARPKAGDTQKLTAAIYSEKTIEPGKYKFFNISSTVAKDVYYLAFEVEGNTTMQSARQRLACMWEDRPEQLRSAQMIWSAMRFSASSFDNPVAALEAGLLKKDFSTPVSDTVIRDSEDFDVVVCGLGTAGATAAVSSGRRKAVTLAIEKGTAPGGVWTGGFIPAPYIQNCAGIAAELMEKAYKREGYFGQSENLKIQLESAVLGSRVRVEYQAAVCGCEKENGRVTSITYRNCNGELVRVKAKVFIDATAEGVLCNLAGAAMNCGRELDREFNSYTNTMGKFIPASFGAANFDAGRVAQYDFKDLSNCYLETFSVHLLEDYSQPRYCIQSADYPGLREGRHIVIENPWNLEKYFQSGGKCEEVIFDVISNLDTHAQDVFFESREFQDWNIAASCWEVRISIPVPMRVLFPAGVSGVIVPSRQLGVDHDLGCAVRMIPGMSSIGEVAGIIAAKACEQGIAPEKVAYSDIKDEIVPSPAMKKADAEKVGYTDLNGAWTNMSSQEIVNRLFSDNPALGIWNIKQQNKPEIARQILSENSGTPAGANAAFALALLDDAQVTSELCGIIERDDIAPVNVNLRYSAPRRIAAAYLLGRLHRAETAQFLISQLGKRDCEKFFGHVVCALLKIGDANLEVRKLISEALIPLAEDISWQMIEQLKGAGAAKRRSDGLLRWHIAKHLDKWGIGHNINESVSEIGFDSHEKWLWQNYKDIN